MTKSVKFAIALSVVLVSGCAGQFKAQTPEEEVAQLSQARLDALLAKDIERAYKFTSPAYRSSVSLARYRPHVAGVGGWQSASVESVSCEEQVCDVRTNITYRTAMIKADIPTQITERWINIDGNWWIYQK